jgi:uncharacterized protein
MRLDRRTWLRGALAVAVAPSLGHGQTAYEREIHAWRRKRVDELTQPDGWLALVGLHWLEEGATTIGSAAGCDIRLPASSPAHLGTLHVSGAAVRFEAAGGEVRHGGRLITSVSLRPNEDRLTAGPLTMIVLRRSDRLALRVWDAGHPARRDFGGIDYFAIDPAYKVTARFVPHTPARSVPIVNVLGSAVDYTNPGTLSFSLHGDTHRLEALLEPGVDDVFFLIFRDQTSGHGTYPAGRYLKAPIPVDGVTTVDFNKAYNPPCAFTEYATCPIPPRQNWLRTRIEAGERDWGGH